MPDCVPILQFPPSRRSPDSYYSGAMWTPSTTRTCSVTAPSTPVRSPVRVTITSPQHQTSASATNQKISSSSSQNSQVTPEVQVDRAARVAQMCTDERLAQTCAGLQKANLLSCLGQVGSWPASWRTAGNSWPKGTCSNLAAPPAGQAVIALRRGRRTWEGGWKRRSGARRRS